VIVVDTSAIVDALSLQDGTAGLRHRLANADLQAPHLIDYEVGSVVRGLANGGRLSEPRAMDLLTDFMDLPIERWPATGALLRRAFQLPHNLSSYDAAYVVLAEALACPLVTRDARLAKAAPSTVEVEVW
jgi:predicted nucleic acid-binding protein